MPTRAHCDAGRYSWMTNVLGPAGFVSSERIVGKIESSEMDADSGRAQAQPKTEVLMQESQHGN